MMKYTLYQSSHLRRADTTGSCEGFRVPQPQGTEDEFWRGIDQNRPTKIPTTAFLDKSLKTTKNKMMGLIEN
jgi:hypothetical protein